jgi:hypothetical protein
VDVEAGALAMENVQHYRAMGSLCRQLAVFDPIHSWKYLIEAQKWEHRAEAEIASHFKECNTAGSSDPARSTTIPGTNDTRLQTSAEASGPCQM